MSLSTVQSSSKSKIQSSLKRWKGDLEPEEMDLFKAFVDEAVPRLRGPYLAARRPRQVLEDLERAFRFATERTVDVKVEITEREKGVRLFGNMNDQPFIVDTMRLFLRNSRADYLGGFNLVLAITRDANGKLVGVGGDKGTTESVVMLEADGGRVLHDPEAALETLRQQLTIARVTVRDFKPMVRTIERFVDKFEAQAEHHPDDSDTCRETAAFLKWLLRDNFVFMGLDAGEPLGIQTLATHATDPAGDWPQPHAPGTVRVRKSRIESPIHRSGRIDEILVTLGRGDDAQTLFARGLFTYRAVTQPCRTVPILRGVLAHILKDAASAPGSYRYKGMANVFDSLPTELLFTANLEAIGSMVDLVFEAEQASDVGVTFIKTSEDAAFCLVAMPKAQYSENLSRAIEDIIVRGLHATYTDHGLFVGRYDTVLAHWYLTGVRHAGDASLQKLSEEVRQLATPWHARLWASLSETMDEPEADRLADTYGRAFPPSYMRGTPADRAVRDILKLDSLSTRQNVLADLFDTEKGLYLRLYQARDVFLTDILPVLDNFGLVVRQSWANEVRSRGGRLYMDSFVLDPTDTIPKEMLLERQPLLESAIEAVFAGAVEDDPLNQLVLTSGLNWQEVDLIRGYIEYSRQLTVKLSGNRLVEILLKNPQMCHALVDFFHARFDPDIEGDRASLQSRAAEHVEKELRYILSHDEDLVFSTMYELLKATIRTNFYRTDRKFHYISFKLDCSKVDSMGVNRPMFEIYVHHREVEGVHLRFGKVARGGLRWSDRDDYRTEVLGLVTTQLVKNVVIVPTGSKGGFYLKRPSPDGKVRRQQADHHYKTFIRGLLDLTDNTVDGKTVPPPRVVRHDPDDPYLVVAADKGTAHLSDTANGISREYGFWLDDAFASGGSVGYDHKGVGITARGAWVLVRRHFAECGIDPYLEDFTCVGIGDMGGDVFGNGLIESKHTKLLAAFNHLHIFLDPDPDPAKTWVERKRLFDCVGGWDQYDTSLVSKGGGVYDRRAKSIPLSPEAQAMLGIHSDEADPNDVINAILRMDVDLLWNGGIGTYIKASTETHAQADDRSNDAVRIDATQLRAKMLGEGGNLGLTAKGRIEAGRLGVRLNTDAIDNSGGVDLSDHEVNLKILLNLPLSRGELTNEQRNALLEELTDEVADLVLANNDAHGRQISRDQIRSQQDIFQFGRAIAFVERNFGVRRRQLSLPTDAELAERAEKGEGLTRPELAVLSAWVKMYVYKALLEGDPKAIPGYDDLLVEYFPKKVQGRFPADIRNHMLANEIAMTIATTKMIADAGAAFFPMVLETTGASVPAIATAFLKAQDLAQTDTLRSTLEELRTSVSLSSLYRSWVMVDAGAREVASYWLSARGRIPTDDELAKMREAAQQVYELQASEVAARNEHLLRQLEADDIPEHVGSLILKAQYLNIALMIWAESYRMNVDFPRMVVQHLSVARASRLQQLLEDLGSRPATGRWDPIALRILNHRFHQLLRQLVQVTPMHDENDSVDDLVPRLEQGFLADVRGQVDEMLDGEAPSVATLLVMEERIAGAISRLTA
ncbi:MAG: NAD-glutamate dehydrogenase [Alphaproteobacteria bacterium]|nr:NAD-glutamate dehydrogenase [Alphaproteobacteria bacterium]